MTHAELLAHGCPVDERAHDRLAHFVDRLLAENEITNLTAIRDVARVWPLHICDSLALLPLIRGLLPRRVVDLGTGGGVPGLPLACVLPTIEFSLIDATRKKIEAVERIAGAIGLTNCQFVWGRGETLAHQPAHREKYDVVIARAVAPIEELARFAAGLVRPGGQAWFMKSCQAVESEMRTAMVATNRHQLKIIAVETVRLPEPHGQRAVVIYEKRGALPIGLPK